MTLQEAYSKVKEHRPGIHPFVNICFCVNRFDVPRNIDDILKIYDAEVKKDKDARLIEKNMNDSMRKQLTKKYG
jgi:hypothetical protein